MTELLPLNNSHLPVRLRLEDYLQLDRSGALAQYQKTELIDGEIFFMNAQHRPHAVAKSRLFRLLADALDAQGEGWEAIVEGSVAIPPGNAPEPDIVVTSDPNGKGLVPLDSVKLIRRGFGRDARIRYDRKQPVYARSGVPEYWIVDVNARLIHQMWDPLGESYAQMRQIAFGDPVVATTQPGLRVETHAL